jgi:hypothetical protein
MAERPELGRAHDAKIATDYARSRGEGTTMGGFPARLATRVLARDGIAAIWKLHEAAASAHLGGHKWAAKTLMEIADAAEEIWRQRIVEEFGPSSLSI